MPVLVRSVPVASRQRGVFCFRVIESALIHHACTSTWRNGTAMMYPSIGAAGGSWDYSLSPGRVDKRLPRLDATMETGVPVKKVCGVLDDAPGPIGSSSARLA